MNDMNGISGKLYALLDSVKKGAESAGETASNAAYMAGKKGEDIYNVVKLNFKIEKLKNDVDNALTEIGKMIYQTHIGGEDNQEILQEKLREIDRLHAEIAELEIKTGKAEKIITCPNCGAEVKASDHAYCGQCGTKL